MAYVEWHGTVPNHFKIKHLMKLLGCRKAEAVGYVACLSAWAIENRPGGRFKRALIEIGAEWEGEVGKLSVAMIEAGWVDDLGDGEVQIHDWHDVTGGYRKARADSERKKAVRDEDKARRERAVSAPGAGQARAGSAVAAPRGTSGTNGTNEQNERKENGAPSRDGGAPLQGAENSGAAAGKITGADLQAIIEASISEEPSHRPPSPSPAVQHLVGIARSVARMPNKVPTLVTYLEAAAARFGAQAVESWLYNPENKGASVIVLTDSLEKAREKSGRIF